MPLHDHDLFMLTVMLLEYSGVHGLLVPPTAAASAQVGLLRVVMSLEEKGPASMRTAGEQVTAAPVTPSKQRLQQQSPSRGRHVLQLGGKVQQSPSRPAAETGAAVTAVAAAAVDAAAAAAGSSSGPQSFRQMPEYLAAWELEVWRKVRL